MSRRIVLASQSIWLMGASQYWDTTWTAWRAFTPNPPKRHEDLLRSHSVEYTQLMSMLNRSHSFVNERAAEHCRPKSAAAQNRQRLEPGGARFSSKGRSELHQSAGNRGL